MTGDPRISCLFDAVSVAMSAKVADVDGMQVERMVSVAQQVLEADDPALRAITEFATQYELHAFDAEKLIELGTTLHDALERAMRPDPVDAGRRDIYG
ncbi:MAG: hypothetical protein AAFX07_00655 [Pseudomonadota bacterium]